MIYGDGPPEPGMISGDGPRSRVCYLEMAPGAGYDICRWPPELGMISGDGPRSRV